MHPIKQKLKQGSSMTTIKLLAKNNSLKFSSSMKIKEKHRKNS
jgi:hypothetical protein